MKIKIVLTICLAMLSFSAIAQTNKKETLFTIDGEAVYTSEFVRVFNKNLDLVKDESQKDIDEYLKLFVNYKLKLKEAKALEFNKKPGYNRELSNYKRQLAKNYLSDTKVTNTLVAEAYNRILNEVNANHVLIRLNDNALPKDTLKAYSDIVKLRNRVSNEGFATVKKDVHNGKTIFAEELGYFSGFKMVYPFENAAYKTPVGEISQPFKTQFGYHVVIVNNKRKSRGEREVAHIMIAEKKQAVPDKSNDSESRINDIYKKLNQGEDFESLAKQFSEDKSSSKNGGKLKPFSGGELSSSIFEDKAFNVNAIGEFTKPFKTNFGWHIIKLLNKKPVAAFSDLKSTLEAKVKRDSRSKLINTSRINTLKERYKVKQASLTDFENILTEDYFKGKWKIPQDFNTSSPLIKIGKKQLIYEDFVKFMVKNQRRTSRKKPFNTLVKELYTTFLNNNLLQYQEDNLEYENQEFAIVLNEYREGLLLFDLMETEIWNAAKNDSVELKNFYETNKNNYFFSERVDAVVASSAKKSMIKQVFKLLNENQSLETIKEKLNTSQQVNVLFTNALMNTDHQALPNNFSFKKGVSKIIKHNDAFVVVKVNEVLPQTLKTYEEAQGKVISDYQEFKEKNWLDGLHKKYKIKINQRVLNKVKSQITN